MKIENEYRDIEIPEELKSLLEFIAKEVHTSWLRWKTEEGFVLGEEKDYERKTHPHMKLWENLPDEHRASDYLAAKAALKVLIAKGIIK
jgi:hypothetical protein